MALCLVLWPRLHDIVIMLSKCCYTEGHYAECCDLFIVLLNVVMLNVILLSVVMMNGIMLNVVMLSVMAP